jgi:hypothetical protein
VRTHRKPQDWTKTIGGGGSHKMKPGTVDSKLALSIGVFSTLSIRLRSDSSRNESQSMFT